MWHVIESNRIGLEHARQTNRLQNNSQKVLTVRPGPQPHTSDTRHQDAVHYISHAHAKCFWWKTSPSVWVTCTRLILITDKRRWRGMERKKSREWEGQKNIFTSLHSGSLSPRGVVRKGRAALLTAFMASGCERGGGMEDRPLTWNSYNPARLTAPVGLMSTIGKWISTTVMTLSQRLDVTEQVHF